VIISRETLTEVCNHIPTLTFPGGSHRFEHMDALVAHLLGPNA
jgi:hypothetical protein